jgi:hypothetical protein
MRGEAKKIGVAVSPTERLPYHKDIGVRNGERRYNMLCYFPAESIRRIVIRPR